MNPVDSSACVSELWWSAWLWVITCLPRQLLMKDSNCFCCPRSVTTWQWEAFDFAFVWPHEQCIPTNCNGWDGMGYGWGWMLTLSMPQQKQTKVTSIKKYSNDLRCLDKVSASHMLDCHPQIQPKLMCCPVLEPLLPKHAKNVKHWMWVKRVEQCKLEVRDVTPTVCQMIQVSKYFSWELRKRFKCCWAHTVCGSAL